MHTQLCHALDHVHVETGIQVLLKFASAPSNRLDKMLCEFIPDDTLRIEMCCCMKQQPCRRLQHLVDALKASGRLLRHRQSDCTLAPAASLVSKCGGCRDELDRQAAGKRRELLAVA